jgi:hypothetical protein
MSIGRKCALILVGMFFMLQPFLSNASIALNFSAKGGEVVAISCGTLPVKHMAMSQAEKHKGCCDKHGAGCALMTGCGLSIGAAMLSPDLEFHQGLTRTLSFDLKQESLSNRSLPPAFIPPKQIA